MSHNFVSAAGSSFGCKKGEHGLGSPESAPFSVVYPDHLHYLNGAISLASVATSDVLMVCAGAL